MGTSGDFWVAHKKGRPRFHCFLNNSRICVVSLRVFSLHGLYSPLVSHSPPCCAGVRCAYRCEVERATLEKGHPCFFAPFAKGQRNASHCTDQVEWSLFSIPKFREAPSFSRMAGTSGCRSQRGRPSQPPENSTRSLQHTNRVIPRHNCALHA